MASFSANDLLPRARCGIFLLLVLCSYSLLAQVDSVFIEDFPQTNRINSGLKFRNSEIKVSTQDGKDFSFRNRSLGLPLSLRYRWISLSYTFPLSDLGTSDQDKARSRGLNLRFYRPKFYWQVEVRKTNGFYLDEGDIGNAFRPDMALFTTALFGLHVFKFRKFSLRASFRNKDRQKRSSGSFLVAGILSRQVLTTDSIRLPLTETPDLTIDRFEQLKVGAGIGYAHSWLIGRKWYITPVGVLGPEFRIVSYDAKEGDRSREKIRVSPRFRARLAFGFNGDIWFGNIIGIYLPSKEVSESLTTRVANTQIRLRIGRRF